MRSVSSLSSETTAVPRSMSPAGALLRSMRPKQWLKNVLVLAVPLAAGSLLQPSVLLPTIVAFVAYCMASSATYLINDAVDVERDQAHPRKRNRPLASGQISRTTVISAAFVLIGVAVALGFLTRPALGFSVLAYLLLTFTYSLWLKREPVIELALLTAGFLLRATAGAAATGLPVSNWFVIVAGFGSLFMAVGKRYSEIVAQGAGTTTRDSLAGYSPEYLRWVSGVSAAVAVTGYCVWAFQVAASTPSTLPWAELSVIPFVMALLRYAVRIDAGDAEAPEDAVLGDRVLIILGAVWALVFALGAFGV